jgi:DNA/RNA-binding protein KIN17
MSESHQRQLLIFAETPDKFLDTYSKDFEEGFLNTLKSTYGTKRTLANTVSRQHQDF